MTQPENIALKPESLLEHAQWAHSLARSLVGEEAAEDLVQETWTAALGARPESRGSLRPWLGTVLGNFARQGWRKDAQRRDREQHFAVKESWPSAADLTERAESQGVLMEQLLKLPESLREVLLLKYFEGLSAAEIGRRQSVAASTIKSRLERGLERLREGLDEQFDGGSETWGLALLPLLQAQPKGTSLVVASRFAWSPLLKLALWLLTGTVGVALLLVIGVNLFRAPPFLERIGVEEVQFEPLVAQAPPASLLARASQRFAVKPAGQGPLAQALSPEVNSNTTLRVRFLDGIGEPVVGVQILIQRRKELTIPLSDSMGRIEFVLPHPLADVGYTIRYRHYELASDRISFQTAPGSVVDLGDVVTTPGGALRGRVMDGLGMPLENAQVSVLGAPKVTKSLGGMISSSPTDLGAGAATTNSNGEFRLTGLLAGDIRVNVSTRNLLHGGQSGWVEIRAGQESSGLVIQAPVVPANLRIEGHVFDPEGNPTRAIISGSYSTLQGSGSFSRSTDRGGFLRLILKQSVEHDLIVSAPRGKHWAPIHLPQVAPGNLDLRLQFKRGDSFQLLATDPTGGRFPMVLKPLPGVLGRVLHGGQPLVGARVSLQRKATMKQSFNGFPVRFESREVHSTISGADGDFALDLQESGEYVIRAAREGLAASESGPLSLLADRGLQDVVIELNPGGSIRGHVVCEPGRNPARTLVAISRGDCWEQVQRVGADGAYHFKSLTPGPWMVKIVDLVYGEHHTSVQSVFMDPLNPLSSAHDFIPFNCHVSEGQTTRFDLLLGELPACQLNGRFELEGQDMSRWRCELLPSGNTDMQRGAPQADFPLDKDGNFKMRVTGEGAWRLVLKQQAEGGLFFSTDVQLSAGLNRWRSELAVARVRWQGASSIPACYLWSGSDGLTAVLQLPIGENRDETWQLLPAGRARLVRLDTSSPSVRASSDPSLPSTWPGWQRFELASGERRVLDLGN